MKQSIGIIFGCPIPQREWRSNEFEARCDLGVDLYSRGIIQTILVTGKCSYVYDSNKAVIESEMMASYLVAHGVKDGDILLEKEATNTIQNIVYSMNMLSKESDYHFISSDYHIVRIIGLLHALGINENVYTHGVAVISSKYKFGFLYIVIDRVYLFFWKLINPGKIRSIK